MDKNNFQEENLASIETNTRILVVDDDRTSRAIHRTILAQKFDVITAASGQEALAICHEQLPDLIVLDVEMPELDGYQTCRLLRKWTNIPIVFVTSHQSMEEHLKAYEAGGNSLFTKPVSAEILLRKTAMAIEQHRIASNLAKEKKALEKMAMGFLSSASQSGALLNFMRASIISHDYHDLAQQLLQAAHNLGVNCSIRILHEDGPTVVTDHGDATQLELSIFEHVSEIGRLFQFKNRLVVNYERVSIIVSNMPSETEEAERAGILRDSLAILAETAEALVLNVDIRKEAQKKAEHMQIALSSAEGVLNELAEKQKLMLLDTRLLLQELVDDIEKTYSWLNTSQTQEATISSTMANAIHRILKRLNTDSDFESQFSQVMKALHAGRAPNTVELF